MTRAEVPFPEHMPASDVRVRFFRVLPTLAAGLTAALGCLTLAGWIFDIAELKSVLPSLATMKPNTALGFIALGLALLLAQGDPATAFRPFLVRALALGAGLIGALTLVEYVGLVDLRIDQLLFSDDATPEKFFPGRMAPATAIYFVFLGIALALDARRPAARFLSAIAGGGGLLALLAYIFGVNSLYAVGAFSTMALHTTIAFLLCSLGVLFTRPESGFMARFIGPTPAGTLARRLLPAAIFIPAALGWLTLRGEFAGYYETRFGVALFATSLILIFSVMIIWTTGALARQEGALAESEVRYQRTLDSMMEGCQIIGFDWRYRYVNNAVAKHGNRSREELLGRTMMAAYPGIEDTPVFDTLRRCMAQRLTAQVESEFTLGGDGARWFELSIQPVPEGLFILSVEITGRRRSEEEIRQRTEELARSNAELERFAYVASHDLQEPLRMVASYLQLLQRRYQGKLDAEADDFIGFAVDGADRMKSLINDLLALSRVGTQGRPFAPIFIEQALARALDNLQLAITESGAAISHDSLPAVPGDEAQLTLLLQNLIGNAVKFHGSEPPRVHVGASRENGNWHFSVRDNGIGIDPQYFDRVFVIFQRLHGREEFPGTGIGLAICRKIVERHGGKIWIESQPGRGAAFHFTLPAAPAAAPQES